MATVLLRPAGSVVRTLSLWLGLIALTVQAVAPLCAIGATEASAEGAGISSIVLCTAHGFQRIQLGADGQPLPPQAPDHKGADCFLCVAMHGGGAFPTPVLLSIAGPSLSTTAAIAIPPVLPPARKFASAYPTRGPPAAVV